SASMYGCADRVLDAWAAEGGVEVLHRESYDRNGNIETPMTVTLEGARECRVHFHAFLRYRTMPMLVSFTYKPAMQVWSVECNGDRTGGEFLVEFEARIRQTLACELRGQAVTPMLRRIELRTHQRADLVYPAPLAAQVDQLVAAFENWYAGEHVQQWGALLIGYPGSGKTTVGGLLAGVRPRDCAYVYCSAKDLATSSDIDRAFRAVELLAPAVLHIDDVDLIARDRRAGGGSLTHTLMERLDGLGARVKVFTVFTSNNPNGIDPAIRCRPGRISTRITFTGFRECAAELIERQAAAYALTVAPGAIAAAVHAHNDRLERFTPDVAVNVCARLRLARKNGAPVTAAEMRLALEETLAIVEDAAAATAYLDSLPPPPPEPPPSYMD
ncbi:AAA family ATPase, partial [Candidatus Uhrbacteria bacterium]|nr:AAA family ATPase [Candidatus Uhrbacteria bacterium]